jgi:hypothetical protein
MDDGKPIPMQTFRGESRQSSLWQTMWPQLFFFSFGIGNAILTKTAVIIEAQGTSTYHQFQKPWFLTTICFFAMFCALPIYMVHSWVQRRRGNTKLVLVHELSFLQFLEFSIPALSDAAEGIVSTVCIVFVGCSIDAMMKSGTLIGVSVISRWVFKRSFQSWQLVAIVGVVISLTVVGASGILSPGESATIRTDRLWVAVIVVLKFITQVGYAVKISYEEYFVQVKSYHAILICGAEGFWSFIMCGVLCLPIAQVMPGPEGNGIREDTIDTLAMIKNSVALVVVMIFAWFLGLAYNVISTVLIGRTSAVVRTLMEAFRTLLIWLVELGVFYGFSASENYTKFRMAGEQWCKWSYVQLAGFVLMTFSLLVYNGIPRFPCFNYGPLLKRQENLPFEQNLERNEERLRIDEKSDSTSTDPAGSAIDEDEAEEIGTP